MSIHTYASAGPRSTPRSYDVKEPGDLPLPLELTGPSAIDRDEVEEESPADTITLTATAHPDAQGAICCVAGCSQSGDVMLKFPPGLPHLKLDGRSTVGELCSRHATERQAYAQQYASEPFVRVRAALVATPRLRVLVAHHMQVSTAQVCL